MTATNRFQLLLHELSTPRFLVGARAFRVVSGSAALFFLTMCAPYRHLLFGPEALYPVEYVRAAPFLLSLFSLPRSTWAFEALYLLTWGVTAAWTAGVATRWTTPLFAALFTSVHNRNSWMGDGGDNLFRIVIWLACFAILDGRPRRNERGEPLPSTWGGLHNLAVLGMAFQLAAVYMSAGLVKVMGPSWRDGTALYYALSAHEYGMPGLGAFVRKSGLLVLLGTYSTVAFQVLFPALVVANRWTRRGAVLMALSFHLGIATTMNLLTFATYMAAVDLLLVTDAEYAWMARKARQCRAWIGQRVPYAGRFAPARTQDATPVTPGGELHQPPTESTT